MGHWQIAWKKTNTEGEPDECKFKDTFWHRDKMTNMLCPMLADVCVCDN